MTALTDLLIYCDLDPHPTVQTVAVIGIFLVGALWVVGMIVEHVLDI
jgi:hypothetical protein